MFTPQMDACLVKFLSTPRQAQRRLGSFGSWREAAQPLRGFEGRARTRKSNESEAALLDRCGSSFDAFSSSGAAGRCGGTARNSTDFDELSRIALAEVKHAG